MAELHYQSSSLLRVTSSGNLVNGLHGRLLDKVGRSYPREAARSATSRPPMLAA